MEIIESIYSSILTGKLEEAKIAVNQAIEQGLQPKNIVDEAMMKAMSDIGQKFENQEAFVPELLMAGRAMKGALEVLQPYMVGDQCSEKLGTIIIGTVQGDLHDIGKNLVAVMLENFGFNVINLGVNITSNAFISAIKEHNAQILCMSALLTTTMSNMKGVIHDLEREGIRNNVKVMVGGAPLSLTYANEIGADGFSENANAAVLLAKQLIKCN